VEHRHLPATTTNYWVLNHKDENSKLLLLSIKEMLVGGGGGEVAV